MKPACSNCFHSSVCGNSSPYCDASLCKQFLARDSVVSVDILHDVQSKCDRYGMLYHEALRSANSLEAEMKQLRLIKQTLEMASGTKFDF